MIKYIQVRLTSEQRRAQILDAAYGLACDGHLMTMSLDQIAKACPVKCSKSTIKYHFKSLCGIRDSVIHHAAIDERNLPIVALAIVNRERCVEFMSDEIKAAALKSLTE